MVTKKTKTKTKSKDSITMAMPGTMGGAKVVLPKESEWPKTVKGSHLTVITFEDGKTKLIWDDEALLRDVRMAILTAESKVPASTLVPKATKKAAAMTASKKVK